MKQGRLLTDFSFTKADRLLKRKEFLHLRNAGDKINQRYFFTNFCPTPGRRSRIGITVSRKVGPATKRNRIKRLLREYFRTHKTSLPGSFDVNIIAKKEAATLSSKQTFSAIETIFSRISKKGKL